VGSSRYSATAIRITLDVRSDPIRPRGDDEFRRTDPATTRFIWDGTDVSAVDDRPAVGERAVVARPEQRGDPLMSGGEGVRTRGDARSEAVSLVVVCGLPGVGKTTVARRAADRLDARLLRTDEVRKDLFPDPEYSSEETAAVYDEVLRRARQELTTGESVVLDGTFRTERLRERAADVAGGQGAAFELVAVDSEESVVRRRIAERNGDASDADFEIYGVIAEEFEPIDCEHATVDNSGPLADTHAQVDDLL
jgi:predicted kinase